MDRVEALRSIQHDLLEYIQKKVKVDFDNARQIPVSFTFGGHTHRIDEVLGRFKTQKENPLNAFLVSVNGEEVYFLYFHFCELNQYSTVHEGYWVLCFRILSDYELMALYREERKMLLNMTLKRVADFHGHLCPDLVLGCKLCEYAQKLLLSGDELNGGMSIIAENCTSALDAIQIILRATLGNQRLQVMDFGKHNYTLLPGGREKGFRLSLKKRHYDDEVEYNGLEQKIMNNQVILEEVVQFQKLLDARVKHLLSLSPEDIFVVESIEPLQRLTEAASVFMECCRCGEQVLKSKTIDYQDKTYCIPCFQRISSGCWHYRLQ